MYEVFGLYVGRSAAVCDISLSSAPGDKFVMPGADEWMRILFSSQSSNACGVI
jgi:hypothetical protein